jgi:putative transposase
MPVRPNFNPDYLYFVTTTAEKHIHIFKRESIIRIILDSLHFLRTSGRMELFAFVIMPNHIHLIGKFSKEHSLSDGMRDFKRHTARQIIRQLMVEEKIEKLEMLQSLNQDNRQEYKVWEDGYDARDIFSQDFLSQKMEYIHYNPCQPQWNLASTPEEYPWSSARFYALDKPAVIPVDDVRDLFV